MPDLVGRLLAAPSTAAVHIRDLEHVQPSSIHEGIPERGEACESAVQE